MIFSFSVKIILISILVFFLQAYIPVINFYSIEVVPDIMIILLVYIGFHYGRFETTISGFIFGFSQEKLQFRK